MQNELEMLAKELQKPTVSRETVMASLVHPAALIRANAVWALGRMAAGNPELLPELQRFWEDPQNQVALMGGVKVAFLAVEGLVRIATPEARAMAKAILERAGSDRELILLYLESEGHDKDM